MKDVISDAIRRKVSSAIEATGGVKAVYGDPVKLNGEEVIPVARITITLGAAASGGGSGDSGASAKLSSMAKGGGRGDADASVRIHIEPIGFLRSTDQGPEFCSLDQ